MEDEREVRRATKAFRLVHCSEVKSLREPEPGAIFSLDTKNTED